MKRALLLAIALCILAGCAAPPTLKRVPTYQQITIEWKPRGICHEVKAGVVRVWPCDNDTTSAK